MGLYHCSLVLLAAVGVPAHAIREVLASRTYTGADG